MTNEPLKATHTPWTIGLNGYNAHIIYEGDDSVATVFGVPINSRVEDCTGPKWAEGMERANRIVHAVNSHHDLIEALRPFAFVGEDDPKDTQAVWEMIYRDRVQDWFSYEDFEAARAILTKEAGHG